MFYQVISSPGFLRLPTTTMGPPDKDTCPICVEKNVKLGSKAKNRNASIHSTEEDPDKDSWVGCDICGQWYHPSCVSITPFELERIFSYHCANCEPEHGPSELRRQLKRARAQIDYVALNQGDLFAVDKSEHPHVRRLIDFSPLVQTKSKQNHIEVLKGSELTLDHVLATRLCKPILIPSANDTGMKLPVPRVELTVDYITEKTGGDEAVEVMDVLSQQSESPAWTLQQWRDYFYTPGAHRDRIRNVISLEVSDVKELGTSFRRPKMVEDLDMVDTVWSALNDDESLAHDPDERPKVTTYCLMSVEGSYTDFHIDFSGTPVYYTICKGNKEFIMYPPTAQNLDIYESWCLEQEQNHLWLCDYEKRIGGKSCKLTDGFKVKLQEGDLFIIPSGWIHSVYTPCDTVVIGGNYLTFMDIPMHLRIYEIERRTGVPSKYRFPKFNKVLWLASWYFLQNTEEFLKKVEPGYTFDGRIKIEKQDDIKGEYTPETEDQKPEEQAFDKIPINSDQFALSTPPFLALDSFFSQGHLYTKAVLSALIPHLRNHLETSKLSTVAKKSIPFKLIGRNVPVYLDKLEAIKDSL